MKRGPLKAQFQFLLSTWSCTPSPWKNVMTLQNIRYVKQLPYKNRHNLVLKKLSLIFFYKSVSTQFQQGRGDNFLDKTVTTPALSCAIQGLSHRDGSIKLFWEEWRVIREFLQFFTFFLFTCHKIFHWPTCWIFLLVGDKFCFSNFLSFRGEISPSSWIRHSILCWNMWIL